MADVLASIDWTHITEILYVAPIATIVVAVSYALLLLGIARFDEARRQGSGGTAVAHAGVAFVGLVGFLGALVYGIVVILDK